MDWEDNRPRWLSECAAEALGVFTYVYCGAGATAALFMSVASKEGSGFGSLLTVGLGYAVGIIIAILIAGPVSGGHLSPGYTIAFWLFRGFPRHKVSLLLLPFLFFPVPFTGVRYEEY
jgi:glycerol uptake facilitator-like aquaporin